MRPNKNLKLRLPFIRIAVHLHVCRRVCEHFAFAGALIDFIGYLARADYFLVVLTGKFAFVIGSIAVYLLHAEEARQLNKLENDDARYPSSA